MRDQIVSIIASSVPRSDALLLAYVVMTNHLHLVLRQGINPLAQFMHPVCRRTALAVQSATGRKGHILERPFRDKPCLDPAHLNPCRANICDDPALYRWSSHLAYCSSSQAAQYAGSANELLIAPLVELFASDTHDSADALHKDYERYVAWRQECDRLPKGALKPPSPPVLCGDAHFERLFGWSAEQVVPPKGARKPDLRDLVLATIRELDPRLDLELLRVRRYGRSAAAIRTIIIKRAILAGFRVVQIARFLNVSETTVSKVATATLGRPNVRFDS
jgi:hypothetical protein